MKRISVADFLAAACVLMLAAVHAPVVMAEAYELPPSEREQFRQQLREAHRQRMLEHHGLTVPAATPAAAPRGALRPRLSVEEREELRHQLREQRRAARPHWHSERAIQGPEVTRTQQPPVTGRHPSAVGRHPSGGGYDRPVAPEGSR